MASASAKPSSPSETATPLALQQGNGSHCVTTALLKHVPETRALRDHIQQRCEEVAAQLDKSHPLTKEQLKRAARATLDALALPESYLGWTMVMLASAFWRDQVAAVPAARRLFLLPHCLRDTAICPATYNELGLGCRQCGACSIGDFRLLAQQQGYHVLIAEGSPIVMKIILSGEVDALVGVACLNVLEKALDKILLAGIPCAAVPLLSSNCEASEVDEDRVRELVLLEHAPATSATTTYVHLMRAAAGLFDVEQLERLVPPVRGGPRLRDLNGQGIAALDPIAATEVMAYDFLARGGKYSRPFITLAVHDALTGGKGTQRDGAAHVAALPTAILRAAMSIETFHKASLVHDDIEDDDLYRYGEPTLHRRYGTPTAINVGDYLIGMGYRLVSREARTLGPETVSDILDILADAHTRLSEGQGAELLWRDSRDKRLLPLDALKIYALKTAPAFEAAILSGIRLAGPAAAYVDPVKQFARHLGVAFQILNDLQDWCGDEHNKLSRGGDILAGRPTVLWALALAGLDPPRQDELERQLRDARLSQQQRIAAVRRLYRQAGVFDKALRLIDKYEQRAQQTADQLHPPALRRLLHYLVQVVLERSIDFELRLADTTEAATEGGSITT